MLAPRLAPIGRPIEVLGWQLLAARLATARPVDGTPCSARLVAARSARVASGASSRSLAAWASLAAWVWSRWAWAQAPSAGDGAGVEEDAGTAGLVAARLAPVASAIEVWSRSASAQAPSAGDRTGVEEDAGTSGTDRKTIDGCTEVAPRPAAASFADCKSGEDAETAHGSTPLPCGLSLNRRLPRKPTPTNGGTVTRGGPKADTAVSFRSAASSSSSLGNSKGGGR